MGRSLPARSAQARSKDVFPLPAGAEMIVTRRRAARSRVATRSCRSINPTLLPGPSSIALSPPGEPSAYSEEITRIHRRHLTGAAGTMTAR